MYKGKNNCWMTQSLFWDMWVSLSPGNRHSDPVFTFDSDRLGPTGVPLINFKRTFVELGDPTGYLWAMEYLGSYDHLLYLLERDWFSSVFQEALEELQTKMRASALKRIVEIASTSPNESQALAASKYLAERGWEKGKVGRPEKVPAPLKREIDIVESDAARLGLTVIPGGKS